MGGCLLHSPPAPEFFDRLAASYSELAGHGDNTLIRYRGNDLVVYRPLDNEQIVLPSEEYPQTISLFRDREILSLYKQNGDVYYVTFGLTDNVKGYIISEDFEIDMTDVVKLERILGPCKYEVFHFSSEY